LNALIEGESGVAGNEEGMSQVAQLASVINPELFINNLNNHYLVSNL
jgi:hypothetical protein